MAVLKSLAWTHSSFVGASKRKTRGGQKTRSKVLSSLSSFSALGQTALS